METFNQATERLGQSYRTIGELQKEIAEKDRQLARKTRLEMLGRMAANLAHEIRNPLVGDMLAFGREIEPVRRLQPLRPLVEQALDLARAALEEKRVRVEVRAA